MAKAAAKTKTPATKVFVPQSRAQVTEAIALIGKHQRERTRIQATMNDNLALIREKFEAEAAPLGETLNALTEGVHVWCEAHRDELTEGGKTKTLIKGAETVIEIFRARGLLGFIRTKEEIDKEAILADPEAVAGIRGVRIEQAEQFVIEPFETELEEIAA